MSSSVNSDNKYDDIKYFFDFFKNCFFQSSSEWCQKPKKEVVYYYTYFYVGGLQKPKV